MCLHVSVQVLDKFTIRLAPDAVRLYALDDSGRGTTVIENLRQAEGEATELKKFAGALHTTVGEGSTGEVLLSSYRKLKEMMPVAQKPLEMVYLRFFKVNLIAQNLMRCKEMLTKAEGPCDGIGISEYDLIKFSDTAATELQRRVMLQSVTDLALEDATDTSIDFLRSVITAFHEVIHECYLLLVRVFVVLF